MTLLLLFLLTLHWNLNPSPDVSGYRVYWRTFDVKDLRLGGPWPVSMDVGNTNGATLATVPNVGYDYVVTCYTTNGIESDFSNEIFVIRVESQTEVNQ